MKIGILLLNIDPSYRGGVNSFIHGLLSGLKKIDTKNEYGLLVYESNAFAYQQYVSDTIKVVTFRDDVSWLRKLKFFIRLVFILPGLQPLYTTIESLLFSKVQKQIEKTLRDVYYAPTVPYFPLNLSAKVIISPHDIQQIHYPEYFSLIQRWYRGVTYRVSMKQASVIQASTVFIKNDFRDAFSIPEEKIKVIPEGVMLEFLNFIPNEEENQAFLKKYNVPQEYIFYPAQHWPHKNHKTLIKATAYVLEKYKVKLHLVFTGEKNKRFQYLYNFIDQGKYNNFIQFLGNIKFSELFYAYHNALMVVIPVVYESSSLPVKEAMALGKAVIASRNGANEEINLNENIILFETYNEKDLGEKMYQMYANATLRQELGHRSKEVVSHFTWENIAKQYITLFETFMYGN